MILVALSAVILAAATPQPEGALIVGFLAQGAAVDARADVLTSADLRNALDLEAQKQVASCGEGSSCLAEIAQALDAHVVLSSSLSSIEDEWVLQVSAYDARKASSAGRRIVRATSQKMLTVEAETAGRELLTPVVSAYEGAGRLRVLVLDVAVPAGGSASPASATVEESPLGALAVGGGITVGVGLLVTVVAVAADVIATTPPTSVKDAEAAAAARNTAGITYPVGIGLALVGASLVLIDGIVE